MSASSKRKKKSGSRRRGTGRERLLEVSVRLFSERGFDGVTVDEIVEAAAINKRMVYHYFGNKEGIYRATLARVFEDLANLESEAMGNPVSPVNPVLEMRRLVSVYFTFLQAHPDFVRMLLWENLSEGRHLAEVGDSLSKSPVLAHVSSLLRQGVDAGVFRPGLDARLVLTSLIGLCLVCFSNRFTLSKSVGLDFGSPAHLQKAARHTAELFTAGLRR